MTIHHAGHERDPRAKGVVVHRPAAVVSKPAGRAPGRILILAFACAAFAAPAEAGSTWLGVQMHFPVPARDVGDSQLGVDAGVTITTMKNAYLGLGADLIHHYWPASTGYQAAFDRYLRNRRFQTLEGSPWAFMAFQFTGHVKVVPRPGGRVAPWAKVGAGAYRLDLNLDAQMPAGTYARVIGPGQGNISVVAGGYGGAGLDVQVSSRVALGVDATLHHVYSRRKGWSGATILPDFSAFTIGTHVLFGW